MARPALAATRAVAVLDFLAAHVREQHTLSDLAARLDINLASTHAVLNALAEAGYVVRHPRLKSYALGPSVVALGSAALERHPAIDHARDEARRLGEETQLGVSVTAVAGDEIVFLARAGEHRPRGIGAQVGVRIPLEPPIGAVFVAWRDPAKWLARCADPDAMAEVLEEVRSLGWAVGIESDASHAAVRDTEPIRPSSPRSPVDMAAGLRARSYQVVSSLEAGTQFDVVMIAAPVFDPSGESLVAITLDGFPPGLSREEVLAYAEQVRDAALVATRKSGGRAPTELDLRHRRGAANKRNTDRGSQ